MYPRTRVDLKEVEEVREVVIHADGKVVVGTKRDRQVVVMDGTTVLVFPLALYSTYSRSIDRSRKEWWLLQICTCNRYTGQQKGIYPYIYTYFRQYN